MTVGPRVKDDELVRCMSKVEAKEYMASLGTDLATTNHILEQYPLVAITDESK